MQARLDENENARLKAIRVQLTGEQMRQVAADAVRIGTP